MAKVEAFQCLGSAGLEPALCCGKTIVSLVELGVSQVDVWGLGWSTDPKGR